MNSEMRVGFRFFVVSGDGDAAIRRPATSTGGGPLGKPWSNRRRHRSTATCSPPTQG